MPGTPTDQPRPLRIACNGYVVAGGGSGTGARHLVLEGLLRRGHEVMFVSKPSFLRPRDLEEAYPNFRYVPVSNRLTDALHERLSRRLPAPGRAATGMLNHRAFGRLVVRAMSREHARQAFDAALWLGLPAFGPVGPRGRRVPAVSRPQGCPGSDARSVRRMAALLRRTEGPARAWTLRRLADWRLGRGLPRHGPRDRLSVASGLSKRLLVEHLGVDPDRVSVHPHPIDLARFAPRPQPPADPGRLRVLWLGRIVPRKRLDLLLAGLDLAVRRGVDVEARVVGGVGFAPGLATLIGEFPHAGRLEYSPDGVPRDRVADLLREYDVLCQPSDEEDFGFSVAEALACGTPALVGQTNGTGEYLCPQSARLADDRPETLAEALAGLGRRKAAGALFDVAATRATAERYFDAERAVDHLESLLRRAAGTTP